MVRGITYEINEEVISKSTVLTMEGRKWKKTNKMSDKDALKNFFNLLKEPVKKEGGFGREVLLSV